MLLQKKLLEKMLNMTIGRCMSVVLGSVVSIMEFNNNKTMITTFFKKNYNMTYLVISNLATAVSENTVLQSDWLFREAILY